MLDICLYFFFFLFRFIVLVVFCCFDRLFVCFFWFLFVCFFYIYIYSLLKISLIQECQSFYGDQRMDLVLSVNYQIIIYRMNSILYT